MARDPNEFAYGFTPPERTPITECAWCGLPLYSEEEIRTYSNDEICPACEKLAYKGDTALDYIVHLFRQGEIGSLESFFKDMKGCDWLEGFGESVRTYFGEDYDKWVKF